MPIQSLQKTTVLVIEDEATQRELLKKHLEALEYEVGEAPNGQEGIKLWQKREDIRIVITDLTMPEIDGVKVVKTIRKKEHHYTYVMILTSAGDKDSLLSGLKAGADDFVTKPILREELALRLKAAMRLLRLEDHDRLVVAMAELTAIRSGELDCHLKRIREYCTILAEDLRKNHPELGLSNQTVEDISNISVLHDIGNICIPDELLKKRGRYSAKEYDIIQKHTAKGAEILESLASEASSSFLQLGCEIALYHHEKWDGSGYPNGLKGEEIPLAARIVAFADAYEAIVSRRPYKDPLPPAHAESALPKENGRHFDPAVVEAFERNKEAFAKVLEKHPEPQELW